jgi:hypothetical protein
VAREVTRGEIWMLELRVDGTGRGLVNTGDVLARRTFGFVVAEIPVVVGPLPSGSSEASDRDLFATGLKASAAPGCPS